MRNRECCWPATTLAGLADAMHGSLNGKWINIPGPGHGKADRSLGVMFDPSARGGFDVHSFAGDDRRRCRAHVKKKLRQIATNGSVPLQIDTSSGVDDDAQAKILRAIRIWDNAEPIIGTLGEKYLATRACVLANETLSAGALRFHSSCPFGSSGLPAMIALVRNVITGEPMGIHRTALRDDGSGKREMPDAVSAKMILGRAKGAVVNLQHVATRLGIAEGIETALSASQIFTIPVLATLSANGLAAFPLIHGVVSLMIFADHDAAGISAARVCRSRYKKAGIEVEVRYPPTAGHDWNNYRTAQLAVLPPNERGDRRSQSSPGQGNPTRLHLPLCGRTERVMFLHASNDGFKLDVNHDQPIEADDLPGLIAAYNNRGKMWAEWQGRDAAKPWTENWWFLQMRPPSSARIGTSPPRATGPGAARR
jgi:putative DNA primase/helicase